MSIKLLQNTMSLKKNRGFTLLEALIGFLILSIGMLGIASLQAVSLKWGKSAVYGSVAMMKVDELFESMRANPTALVEYEKAGINKNCATTTCDDVALALDDVYWWEQNLKAGLPASTTTSVTVSGFLGTSKMRTVTVELKWNERKKIAAGSVGRTYSTTAAICAEIPC